MKKTFTRWSLRLAIIVLYLLHNDFWLWDRPTFMLGIPIGLLYHIGFCIVTSILMMVLVKYSWPHHLDSSGKEE